MKGNIRKLLVEMLWEGYKSKISCYEHIQGVVHLDHFAIIDLPSQYSGIEYLDNILTKIGFVVGGEGYLPDKHNAFEWLRDEDFTLKEAKNTTAQAVIADFRLNELSTKTRDIIEKYSAYYRPIDANIMTYYEEQIDKNNHALTREIAQFLYLYLICKAWPAIEVDEYQQVLRENELLAWVLAFGRVVNHFGISIHLLGQYHNLHHFNEVITQVHGIGLHSYPQVIKGGEYCGLEQSSTEGKSIQIPLKNDVIEVRDSFLEFVWRYPNRATPVMATDYYQDFIPNNANHVIESLYNK